MLHIVNDSESEGETGTVATKKRGVMKQKEESKISHKKESDVD